MDYKKLYKESLDRAKNIYGASESKDILSTLTTIFPELRQNEDEKIKKDIIYFLSRNTFQFGEDIDKYKAWIAWLEKQGESKFEQCIQEGDKLVTNEDGTHFNISQLERVAKKESSWNEENEKIRKRILLSLEKDLMATKNSGCNTKDLEECITWLKKQDEQKPINDTDEEIVNALKDTSVLDLVEPNSAWSEEDEKIVLSVEQVMNCASLLNIVPEKVDKIRTWLKSLKERMKGE